MKNTKTYSLHSYGSMIRCAPRSPAFVEALRGAVTPGAHVIDIGAGPGLFALLACKFGANHVAAIDPDASIELARIAGERNGFTKRLTIVRDLTYNYQPEEKADVIISDIRGVLPLFEHHIPAIKDARDRLLKPGGTLIPAQDRIFAALVEAPKLHEKYRSPWLENDYGVDLSAGFVHSINHWGRTYQPSDALLTAPLPFATLDYKTIEETNHSANLDFKVKRPGTAHGILMWFETTLAPGIGYSNAPGEPEQIYGQAFFPLEGPVSLAEGGEAQVTISADLIDGDYIWSWAFRATDQDGQVHAFRQSTFKATIRDKATLAPRSAAFKPAPVKEHAFDQFCLALIDGERTLEDIAAAAMTEFPDSFADQTAALTYVADLNARYQK